jgi:hypothetical protein
MHRGPRCGMSPAYFLGHGMFPKGMGGMFLGTRFVNRDRKPVGGRVLTRLVALDVSLGSRHRPFAYKWVRPTVAPVET